MSGHRHAYNPPGHYTPIKPYSSQAVRVGPGSLIFTSAEAPLDAEGRIVSQGDAAGQMCRCLEKLRITLEAAGAGLGDVVSMDGLLRDVDDFERIAPVREEYFPSDGPAAFLAAGVEFPIPGMLLEIRAVAALEGEA